MQRFPSRATEPVALWGLGVYAQDEWRVNKSLKLTLALRVEAQLQPGLPDQLRFVAGRQLQYAAGSNGTLG